MTPTSYRIPFNRPAQLPQSLDYIKGLSYPLWGRGEHTRFCEEWLERETGCSKALLTPSCTSALELASLLMDIAPGDEIILPSYTFVSSASAFAIRGGVPVFVDIRPDTLNIDAALIEQAITPRTRAVLAMHYGGVACDMDTILAIARKHNLMVIEDAAHAIGAHAAGAPLGSLGHFATLSFHETKNITCGQGGALLINDAFYIDRARILHDKGTNRYLFEQGKTDHYSWVELGSNFVLSEIQAAYLHAQLEQEKAITATRRAIWQNYHQQLQPLAEAGLLQRPGIPPGAQHNGHLYYVLVPEGISRDAVIAGLALRGINAVFHYVPLHESPMGQRIGRVAGSMQHTESLSRRLLRLPVWSGMEGEIAFIVQSLRDVLTRHG